MMSIESKEKSNDSYNNDKSLSTDFHRWQGCKKPWWPGRPGAVSFSGFPFPHATRTPWHHESWLQVTYRGPPSSPNHPPTPESLHLFTHLHCRSTKATKKTNYDCTPTYTAGYQTIITLKIPPKHYGQMSHQEHHNNTHVIFGLKMTPPCHFGKFPKNHPFK